MTDARQPLEDCGALPGRVLSTQPRISLISTTPVILYIEDFLPPHACQDIIRLSKPLLQKSLVATGEDVNHRTSDSTFLIRRTIRAPCIELYERRVTELMKHPAVRSAGNGSSLTITEAVQVARYQVGQHYSQHFDNKSSECWRRAATLIVYLSDVEEGGGTFFPLSSGLLQLPARGGTYAASACSSPGLRITPRQGCAILFWSQKPDGTEDPASLHAAEPVLAGEKWICSRWFSSNLYPSCPAGDPLAQEE